MHFYPERHSFGDLARNIQINLLVRQPIDQVLNRIDIEISRILRCKAFRHVIKTLALHRGQFIIPNGKQQLNRIRTAFTLLIRRHIRLITRRLHFLVSIWHEGRLTRTVKSARQHIFNHISTSQYSGSTIYAPIYKRTIYGKCSTSQRRAARRIQIRRQRVDQQPGIKHRSHLGKHIKTPYSLISHKII